MRHVLQNADLSKATIFTTAEIVAMIGWTTRGREEMRLVNGKVRTLEQDIQEIWEAHGWEVLEETVPKSDGVTVKWIITAKLVGKTEAAK